MLRRSGGLDSRSVSSKKSGTRPTCARHRPIFTLRSPIGASTSTPSTRRTGRSSPLFSKYASTWRPLESISWRPKPCPLERVGDALLAELGQQKDRILPSGFPKLAIKGLEQAFDPWLPGPEQIASELIQFVMQDLRWYRLSWVRHEGRRDGWRRRVAPTPADEPAAEAPCAGRGAADHGAHPSAPASPPDARRDRHGAVPGRFDPQLLRRWVGAGRGADLLGRGLAARHRRVGHARAPAAKRAVP